MLDLPVNQLEDVEIDRVNKPFLPIAAGDLSLPAGRRIVVACAVVPLVLAVLVTVISVFVAIGCIAVYDRLRARKGAGG